MVAGLSDVEIAALIRDWSFVGRPEQHAPPGLWSVWALIMGRGGGKTRAGAEWIRERVRLGFRRLGLIAPTAGDARDVMVEGESGLLAVCHPEDRDIHGRPMGVPQYLPSMRRLVWENRAVATLYSADRPDRLRGPQHDSLWCDELAAWRYLRESWDNAQLGLRLGEKPQTVITTTPKPVHVLREIVKDPGTKVTRGSTYSNRANLSGPFLAYIRRKYEGTRTGRQEIEGELLDEAEGALWSRALLDRALREDSSNVLRIVVAIDPATTKKEDSDETGIIAAARLEGFPARGRVLADASGRYSPGEWSSLAVAMYRELRADCIVAEVNNGGDMVAHTIHTVDPNVPVRVVHASRAKAARAEPVAALYEQDRISHAAGFPQLEDQLVTWEPLSGNESPDRLDALVWAFTNLILEEPTEREMGRPPEVVTA